MKRSLILLFTSCLLAVAFVFDLGVSAAHKVAGFASATLTMAGDLLLKTFTGPAPLAVAPDVLPERRIEQAAAFVRRLVKRERPVLSSSWRMAPSV